MFARTLTLLELVLLLAFPLACDRNPAAPTLQVTHELGHGFPLHLSCDTHPNDPNCGNSTIQTGEPWDAILHPSPFFF